MPTYYTFIPTSDTPTGETTAPDARHAKTAYLDYLSRSGLIAYSQRGQIRKVIRATKMEPGEFQTSVQLEYGQGTMPNEQQIDEMAALNMQDADRRQAMDAFEDYGSAQAGQPGINIPASAGPVDMQFTPKQGNSVQNSPIANISRQSRGV